MVAADFDIDGGVELDARHLRSRKKLPDVDVMDGVAGDGAERGTQAADDARLLAVGDVVVADDVMADGLLVPAVLQGPVDGLDVALGAIRRRVVPLVAVFAERDARTNRVADHVVLDDPAFAPMSADQADLLGRGRGPGRGRMAHGEAAHGDVVDAGLFRIKHCPPDIDLHHLLVRVYVP